MIRAGSEQARQRIIAIATQIVASQIKAGEIDPEDETALRAATRRAVADAAAAYRAAEEFAGG